MQLRRFKHFLVIVSGLRNVASLSLGEEKGDKERRDERQTRAVICS